jgi:hypothetical protein
MSNARALSPVGRPDLRPATRRILLVADRTPASLAVARSVLDRAAAAPCSVTVLVPASPGRGGWTWDEAAAAKDAARRLRALVSMLRAGGVGADGLVGDARPIDAIRDVVCDGRFDEIVISSRRSRLDRWLRRDLLTQVSRLVSEPVLVRAGPQRWST